MNTKYFKSAGEFRNWLETNHDKTTGLWVIFLRKHTAKPSMTWPESVDEALCFGWIDGLRKGIDKESYKIRFSPRKPRSIWSAVNIKRATKLIETGRMQPTGLKAFEARKENRSGIYSYEQRPLKLDEIYETKLRANKKAWNYFQSKAPWYRRAASWWIMSAKREETRFRRLAILIEDCAHERTIGPLRRWPKTDNNG
jgi:uncharacterized protein YdeI (YjbR/CyaY-like superfamily)